jgi:hypothetical protein
VTTMTGWKKPPSRHAGPWLRDGKWRPEARWVGPSGGPAPSVGGSALQRVYGNARAQAYARYVDRISTAYLKNRRPFVPGG